MSVTVVIIVVTVIASMYAWNQPQRLQQWLLNPYLVQHQKQYYRFITSGLIHSNTMHLLLNMIALYFFGRSVEITFINLYGSQGLVIFVLFYLLGIIVSDIPTFLKNRDNPHYNSLGASGGVAALVFSSILFFPLNKIYFLFLPIGIPGFILGTLYLIYSYYQAKGSRDNINHDAHFYGAVFGLAFTLVLEPAVLIRFFREVSSFSFF